MPSRFAQLQAIAVQAVADEFAEATLIIPRDDDHPYLVGDVNATVMPFELRGVVSLEDAMLERPGRKTEISARLNGNSGEVRFAVADFASCMKLPRSGDQIQLITRDGEPTYRVSHAGDSGRGRWVCTVEKVS